MGFFLKNTKNKYTMAKEFCFQLHLIPILYNLKRILILKHSRSINFINSKSIKKVNIENIDMNRLDYCNFSYFLLFLTSSYLEHFRITHSTYSLSSRSSIFHGYLFIIFHFSFCFTFNTISFHLFNLLHE